MSAKGLVVCVDFDKTLFDHGQTWTEVGQPIHGGKEALRGLMDENVEIVISSGRANRRVHDPYERNLAIVAMLEALERHRIPYSRLDLGDEGKIVADAYVDDRAIRFTGDWRDALEDIRKVLGLFSSLRFRVET